MNKMLNSNRFVYVCFCLLFFYLFSQVLDLGPLNSRQHYPYINMIYLYNCYCKLHLRNTYPQNDILFNSFFLNRLVWHVFVWQYCLIIYKQIIDCWVKFLCNNNILCNTYYSSFISSCIYWLCFPLIQQYFEYVLYLCQELRYKITDMLCWISLIIFI